MPITKPPAQVLCTPPAQTLEMNIFLQNLAAAVNALTAPPSYGVAGLPNVIPAGRTIYVSDEAGGAVLAFSDGVNWLRSTDRAVVS